LRDESRWRVIRSDPAFEAATAQDDGLTDIETVLTADQLAEVDARIPSAEVVA
jgi:manganese/zinc/iron transport system permease protein